MNNYDVGDEISYEFYKSKYDHDGFKGTEVVQVPEAAGICDWKLKYIDRKFFKDLFFLSSYLEILFKVVSSEWNLVT